MNPKPLDEGDVVQFNPETVGNKAFAGCLAFVHELKSFGAIVGVVIPGPRDVPAAVAYYRATFDELEFVGHAPFGAPA